MSEPYEYDFTANSALYNSLKQLMFTRNGLSYRVSAIFNDDNGRNLKIGNDDRLKSELISLISAYYNQRIEKYSLRYNRLSHRDHKSLLNIKKPKIVSSEADDNEFSGYYKLFPKQFVCKKCGDLRQPKGENIRNFDIHNCKINGCNGEYEQISVLRFCEKCGKVDIFYYQCKNDKTHPVKLKRGKKDSLKTWVFKCTVCGETADILTWKCGHKDFNGEIISDLDAKQFKPLTIRETGIFTPLVKTVVDLPETKELAKQIKDDIDYVLLGLYLDSFKNLTRRNIKKLYDIEKIFAAANNIVAAEEHLELADIDIDDKDESEILQLYSEKIGVPDIENKINELKHDYHDMNISQFKDFIALLGKFTPEDSDGPIEYDEYIKERGKEETEKHERYLSYKSYLGINNVTYIPRVRLLSSLIGYIKGPNKFYEPGFVPHFEPLWDKNNENLEAYTYPFETEGIMIELDKEKLVNWLYKNGLIGSYADSYDGASEILMKLNTDSEAYRALENLIHSLAHLLIRLSSVHTGIDYQSCSELIFTNPASLFIYSTSNVNIGGFQYLFENSLYDWFKDLVYEAQECTFDPICNQENGSCFSCMYLPEYVCNLFNNSLDRDVFLAKSDRYIEPFWSI